MMIQLLPSELVVSARLKSSVKGVPTDDVDKVKTVVSVLLLLVPSLATVVSVAVVPEAGAV